MKYFLITQDGNYADEFDVSGFRLVKFKSEKDLLDSLKPTEDIDKWPKELYFGSNASIEYNDLEEYLGSFGISELKESEYKIIEKFLGTEYGHFLTLD